MKQLSLVLWFSVFSIYNNSYAQLTWEYLNPIPTSSELNEVQFVTKEIGWAIGSWGTLIHTTDGGFSWKLQSTPLDDICGISFINESYGWLIGVKLTGEYYWGYPLGMGYVINTKDGGESWQQQIELPVYTTSPFSIFFIDKNIGWATYTPYDKDYNATIIKTSDGGINWSIQDSIDLNITDTYFIDSQIGWAVGGWSETFEAMILRTDDGGENWRHQSGGVKGVLGSVFFINENIGWAVGNDNTILCTHDGGTIWEVQSIAQNLSNHQFTSVYFTDSNKGFIAGWEVFLSTTNGGQNWTVLDAVDPTPLSVYFWDNLLGWRVGYGGMIQQTTDGGQSWHFLSKSFTNEEFVKVDFVDKLNGWILSPERIYHTTNGGDSWDSKKIIPTQGLEDIFGTDALRCYAVGYNWENSSGFILKTLNAGNDWELINIDYDVVLRSAFFLNNEVGWVVGDSGIILHTYNGGENWIKQENNTNKILSSVDFVDDKNGWIAGENGITLKTSDGGKNWSINTTDTIGYIRSIDFIDSLNGWMVSGNCWPDAKVLSKTNEVVGCSGSIWRSKDGGISWVKQLEGHSVYKFVKFIDLEVGFVSGGQLLCTKDGGENWELQHIPFDGIASTEFVDERTGWIVGMGGAIMRTLDGSISAIDLNINTCNYKSTHYVLFPNYPNPFNPTTTIKYSIPKQSNVKLKIFDLLGSEVATLVNKEQQQGNYEVEFNPSADRLRLTSGVYLYRLQADDYVETKKMMLIK